MHGFTSLRLQSRHEAGTLVMPSVVMPFAMRLPN